GERVGCRFGSRPGVSDGGDPVRRTDERDGRTDTRSGFGGSPSLAGDGLRGFASRQGASEPDPFPVGSAPRRRTRPRPRTHRRDRDRRSYHQERRDGGGGFRIGGTGRPSWSDFSGGRG